MQPLLERVRPLRPFAGVVRNDPASRSCHRCLRARACTPSRGCRLHRLRGTPFQVYNLSLSGHERPVPPSVGVFCFDRAGRSYICCWSATGYHPSRVCVVFTDPWEPSLIVCSLQLLECKGPMPPSPVVAFVNTAGSFMQIICREILRTDTCKCRLRDP